MADGTIMDIISAVATVYASRPAESRSAQCWPFAASTS
jgi:hypothetical protein